MVISTQELLKKYSSYGCPKMKIKRDVDSGKYFLIKKGLYETNGSLPGYLLTQYIKSPSYISFEYVLSINGVIPEFVQEYTCATTGQRHSFKYENRYGRYSYRDVPLDVFYLDVRWVQEGDYSYLIASKEKALCDLIYTISPVTSKKLLKSLLFDSLRIDISDWLELDLKKLAEIASKYKTTNHRFLISVVEDFLK